MASSLGTLYCLAPVLHRRFDGVGSLDEADGQVAAWRDAVCPGMMNTPTAGLWWDVSDAPAPADAAVALLDLVLDPVDPAHYGQLVRDGKVLPWAPRAVRLPTG